MNAAPLAFDIQPSHPTPIYRQIVEQVHRRVSSGQWQPGEELPSVRALAQMHAINPMTVSKAYSLLEADGWLERRRGMGMVIAPRRRGSAAGRWALLLPTLQSAARQAVELGLTDEEVLQRMEELMQAQRTGGGSQP